jgi:hypothetical protein
MRSMTTKLSSTVHTPTAMRASRVYRIRFCILTFRQLFEAIVTANAAYRREFRHRYWDKGIENGPWSHVQKVTVAA